MSSIEDFNQVLLAVGNACQSKPQPSHLRLEKAIQHDSLIPRAKGWWESLRQVGKMGIRSKQWGVSNPKYESAQLLHCEGAARRSCRHGAPTDLMVRRVKNALVSAIIGEHRSRRFLLKSLIANRGPGLGGWEMAAEVASASKDEAKRVFKALMSRNEELRTADGALLRFVHNHQKPMARRQKMNHQTKALIGPHSPI
ncbi:MAG: hypothetical protein SPK06_04570 [Kiritimatiellia bacterium]|nr:hypothetical protein [Kiritimatiellia bacterium]